MIGLPELQRRFVRGLLQDQPEAVEAFVCADHFTVAERLSVYRNNVYAGLTGALQACYPVTCRLVGEDYFRQAARGYIRAHPSQSGDLQRFGADFPAHLGGLESARALAYLEDVARLEWSRQEVYHAAEAEPFVTTALADVAPADYGRLVFKVAPAVRWLQSPWPIARIWELHQAEDDHPWQLRLDTGGQQVLIVRRQLQLHQEAIERPAYCLLALLAQRLPLEAAVERLAADDTATLPDLEHCLRHWVELGVFTGNTTLA